MERVVVYLCGLWFWLTRRSRVDAYSRAAATLELAHAYLLRDFFSRASTRDRGLLLPFHHEALSILQNHAVDTYVAATRMASFRECCQFVSEELRALSPRPAAPEPPAVQVVLRPVPVGTPVGLSVRSVRSDRFSLPGSRRLPDFAHFVAAESSGSIWDRRGLRTWRLRPAADSALSAEPAEQPLKAA